MNKKFLSLVLALVMVLGTFSSVFAAKPAEKKEAKEAPKATEKVVPKITGKKAKIQWLQDNGYVEGRKVNEDPKNNDLALDKNIQRAEVSKLLVYAIGRENLANKIAGTFKPYSDVDNKHWANGFITVGSTEKSPANELAFLIGYPDKTFKPANNVTYAELAKMLVTLAKTDLTKDMHDKANKDWPRQWMAWAAEMGILEDVDVKNSNDPAVREDAFTMIYNAMYKLKYIKKMPAAETMGILSQIKNGEITLNQGDKAKTAKITPNTTFVLYDYRTSNDVNANERQLPGGYRITTASAIGNPEFYYGSLMRVITNEKGEATHVLELGNPEYLAIGINGWNGDNARWADVADATVETRVTGVEAQTGHVNGAAAKINYTNSDPTSITFQLGHFGRTPVNETGAERYNNSYVPVNGTTLGERVDLRLTKDTRYFVADVRSNQLTEVKDVDEAIRILGNVSASNWFFNVYAGYNKIDGRPAHETSQPHAIEGYNEATVVVFNAVQKDNNHAELLRVRNEATSKYDITFENTDGAEVMKNVASYREAYPFNYKDAKLNVVEYTVNAARGINVELKIKHSDTDKYPIVKVEEIDGRNVFVVDEYGNRAGLQLGSEYDLFIKGQLKEGALIQFRTVTNNTKNGNATDTDRLEIVSVMPKEYKGGLKGNVKEVVYGNQKNQKVGTIALKDILNEDGNGRTIVKIDTLNKFFHLGSGRFYDLVKLNNDEAKALKTWLENLPAAMANKDEVRFKVKPYTAKEDIEIYDIEVNVGNVWKPVKTVIEDMKKAQQKALDEFNKKLAEVPAEAAGYAGDKALKDANVAQLKQKVEDLKKEFEALKTDQLKEEDVKAAKDNLNKAIKAFNDAAKAAKTAGSLSADHSIDEVK